MRDSRKTCWPVRFAGSLGRNQEAQRGMMRGAVEIFVGTFLVRAKESSEGVTR